MPTLRRIEPGVYETPDHQYRVTRVAPRGPEAWQTLERVASTPVLWSWVSTTATRREAIKAIPLPEYRR